MTLLEDDVTDLQDEVQEMETDINQLDDGLILVEGNVAENSNDIDGKPVRSLFGNYTTMCCYSVEKLKPDTDVNHLISDLETSVAETEDLISVLDDDVTDLDTLVATLQEENAQLQQTVNLLLQGVSDLKATDSITNHTLDGSLYFSGFNLFWHTYFNTVFGYIIHF